jgi:hypothetical protein
MDTYGLWLALLAVIFIIFKILIRKTEDDSEE